MSGTTGPARQPSSGADQRADQLAQQRADQRAEQLAEERADELATERAQRAYQDAMTQVLIHELAHDMAQRMTHGLTQRLTRELTQGLTLELARQRAQSAAQQAAQQSAQQPQEVAQSPQRIEPTIRNLPLSDPSWPVEHYHLSLASIHEKLDEPGTNVLSRSRWVTAKAKVGAFVRQIKSKLWEPSRGQYMGVTTEDDSVSNSGQGLGSQGSVEASHELDGETLVGVAEPAHEHATYYD